MSKLSLVVAMLALWSVNAVAADPRPTATAGATKLLPFTTNCPLTLTGSRDDAITVTVTRAVPEINTVSFKVFRPGQPVLVTHGKPLCAPLLDLRKTGSASGKCKLKGTGPGTYTVVMHVPAEYGRPYRGLIESQTCDVRR